MVELIAGLAIGFVGSLHCIGMCGPLALALPDGQTSRVLFYAGRILYNAGRVVTYAIMGVIMGTIGRVISLAGWQQPLSILAGFAILVALFLPTVFSRLAARFPGSERFSSSVRQRISALFAQRKTSALFLIGILNGLLPCGFVYVGLAGAATTGAPVHAALFMIGFGLGTVPAMFGVSIAGKLLTVGIRRKLTAFSPVLAFVVAVLIILRGMDLGIPYISPAMSHTGRHHQQADPDCCK